MAYRSRQTLEAWLSEFRELGYPVDDSLRVIDQDGDAGANTGLVAWRMVGAKTSVYIQPSTESSERWLVTFEERDEDVEMDAARVAALASELVTISALCAFLEARSAGVADSD